MAELTLDDLVDRLGHDRTWWKREIAKRDHPHLRVGRFFRFTEEDYLSIRESYRHRTDDGAGDTTAASEEPWIPGQSLTSRSRNTSRKG